MAVLTKDKVAAPLLPKETVTVAALNGDVIVQGLMLTPRLELVASAKKGRVPLSALLAATVVDAKGEQLFTEDEWEVFGAKHFDESMKLYEVATRLSGLNTRLAAKN